MSVLVSVETVLLVLLLVLVAGLLRSHAEILRRLGPAPGDGEPDPASALPSPPRRARPRPAEPAPALAGTTPAGDHVHLDFAGGGAGPTLLAFLSTGCSTCAGFWAALSGRDLPGGVEPVIVTHGSERERPARVRELAPAGVPVLMSSQAWTDYAVPGAPYFVLVEGSVRGEGVATGWSALSSLVADAVQDAREGAGVSRARDVDAVLRAGGIGEDHPSLYPAGRPGAGGAER